MSEDLEKKVRLLEDKIEEIINAHNKHQHRVSINGRSDYPTYPIKKESSI